MARKKRVKVSSIRQGDEYPFPSSPQRPPTINIWIRYGPDHSRLQIHCLRARWAARVFVDMILNGREFDGEGPDDMGWLETDDGETQVRLTGDVKNLMDEDVRDWVPPQPHYNQLMLASGREAIMAEPDPDDEKVKTRKVRASSNRGATKVSRDGLVTLAELCAELGIEARDARKKLRGKVEKPDTGWAWPADEAAKVKAILK